MRPVVHECHITGQNSIFISDRPNEDNDMKQTQIDKKIADIRSYGQIDMILNTMQS